MEEEQVPGKYIQEKGRDRMRRQEMRAGKQQQEEERMREEKMGTGKLIKEQKGFVSH